MTARTQPHDRRIHADALRKQHRKSQWDRFKRQAGIMASSIALGAVAVPYIMLDQDRTDAIAAYATAKAKLAVTFGRNADAPISIRFQGQTLEGKSASATIAHPYYRQSVYLAFAYAIRGAQFGFAAWLSGLFLFHGAMRRRRERALQDRVITGTRVIPEKKLAKLTAEKAGPHALAIGKVPIPAKLETRHMAMIGTTGSGKTTALRQMLDGIEARGEAALVYDTSGEFIAHYYDPARGDVILNPFDDRCAFWTPFAEIAHPADAARIAHHFITEAHGQHGNDVWMEISRILVANILRELWKQDKPTQDRPTLADLLTMLQNMTKEDLKERLKDTSSARTFADDADRATGSVLFMLAKAADLIQFLRVEDSGGKPFAFRDFIHGLDKREGPRPWIFVPRKEDYFEASKPLLACWLECAASAVLGLPPSPDRRIWFVLDELADLPRVDNLARLLPEGRKFGAAVVLTFQALGQMQNRYGPQIAESILGCCNTKLFLQTIDAETRQWASDAIGSQEVEIQTMTDALADGVNDPRTTLGRIRRERPAVLESELRLPAYQGYLLFPDGLPVAKISLTADHIKRRGPARQPGFIAGKPGMTLWEQMGLAPPEPSPSPPPPSPTSQGPV
ncbi:Type IV secretory pathway, VirD4 component, TraG/TraD family ATPase [Sphingomonas laterariae]|uniref:Type IV secretory pathway, VirD4 component, TraG/TraD family ATPase n=1 Tax=Edaphosphingomonas laterariae TaxID=861865 RepID=A0A239K9X4_9SPHN|nr:type IV secretion system DNA-binding domain-containing protein [Sphingomonas laterariae]SNT15246.1 Type IV secretory pathway, VirD4 component, TraG/TraD family ATPase [Sphingomonas laterariae]